MFKLQRILSVVLPLFLSGCSLRVYAQDTTLQAELPSKLTADALSPGSSFALKVKAPWHDGRCSLIPGSVLHAAIERNERTAKGHTGTIVFSISIACVDEQPLNLVVTSLLAPTEVEMLDQQFFHSSSFGEGGGLGNPGNTGGNTSDMSGRQNPTLPFSNGGKPLENGPKSLHLGEVWRIPRVKLVVPTPGATASTITTTATALTLPARTTFVLQGSRMERQQTTLTAVALKQPLTSAPRVRHPFIKACLAEHCARRSNPLIPTTFGVHLLQTPQDLAPYGFRGEHDRELKELDSGASVQYVGSNELLVTFPSHRLIKQAAGRHNGVHPRSIKAVLLDASTHTLLKTEDWDMEDSAPYVWTFGQHVLVHEGQTLRLYGPGLAELASFPLDGPLATLRVSPDGTHALVGRVHELHTGEEHDMLLQADARGPEEEVQWSLLDGDLKVQQVIGSSSTFKLPPVLLDGGLLELRKETPDRWHLVRRAWNATAEEQLGPFDSSCMPTLETTQPDLLVLSTCDTHSLGAHTLLLHEDGTPVLDQISAWHDLPTAHASAATTDRVALLLTRGKEAYTRGSAFRLSTLEGQTAEVLSAGNGVPLASLPMTQFSPYKRGLALSPDGTRLAILSGTEVSFYNVGP